MNRRRFLLATGAGMAGLQLASTRTLEQLANLPQPISVQWRRSDGRIVGYGDSYTLTGEDVGMFVQAEVLVV